VPGFAAAAVLLLLLLALLLLLPCLHMLGAPVVMLPCQSAFASV